MMKFDKETKATQLDQDNDLASQLPDALKDTLLPFIHNDTISPILDLQEDAINTALKKTHSKLQIYLRGHEEHLRWRNFRDLLEGLQIRLKVVTNADSGADSEAQGVESKIRKIVEMAEQTKTLGNAVREVIWSDKVKLHADAIVISSGLYFACAAIAGNVLLPSPGGLVFGTIVFCLLEAAIEVGLRGEPGFIRKHLISSDRSYFETTQEVTQALQKTAETLRTLRNDEKERKTQDFKM